jgi:5,10-methylenetetrahydromethanopterin reductase
VSPKLGVVYQRENAPEDLAQAAVRYESLGFDDMWLVEDLGFAGGIASAAVALQATQSINVGIGILAAVIRNPVFAAMEVSTLARAFPGRFMPGIGHGIQDWMGSVGARVDSPMRALRESVEIMSGLLAGETVTMSGRYHQVRDVALRFPPRDQPLVLAGVRGPKSLSLAGELCDGALLGEPVTPGHIRWAAAQMALAAGAAGRSKPQLGVYAWMSVDEDGELACDRLRPALARALADPVLTVHLEQTPIMSDVLHAVRGDQSWSQREAALRADWIRELAIAGTAKECAAAVAQLAAAGADRIILMPVPGGTDRQVDGFVRQVVPLLER